MPLYTRPARRVKRKVGKRPTIKRPVKKIAKKRSAKPVKSYLTGSGTNLPQTKLKRVGMTMSVNSNVQRIRLGGGPVDAYARQLYEIKAVRNEDGKLVLVARAGCGAHAAVAERPGDALAIAKGIAEYAGYNVTFTKSAITPR
jgi:hypothetical protein